METPPAVATHEIHVEGHLSRAEAEGLQLEMRRLARRHGMDVVRVRVERIEDR